MSHLTTAPPITSTTTPAPPTTSFTTTAPPTSTLATPTTEYPEKPQTLYHSAETFFKKEFEKLSASCGRPVNNEKFIFTNNRRLSPGQWPWLAAIFITREIFEFQCTGTLISDRHILTGNLIFKFQSSFPPNHPKFRKFTYIYLYIYFFFSCSLPLSF